MSLEYIKQMQKILSVTLTEEEEKSLIDSSEEEVNKALLKKKEEKIVLTDQERAYTKMYVFSDSKDKINKDIRDNMNYIATSNSNIQSYYEAINKLKKQLLYSDIYNFNEHIVNIMSMGFKREGWGSAYLGFSFNPIQDITDEKHGKFYIDYGIVGVKLLRSDGKISTFQVDSNTFFHWLESRASCLHTYSGSHNGICFGDKQDLFNRAFAAKDFTTCFTLLKALYSSYCFTSTPYVSIQEQQLLYNEYCIEKGKPLPDTTIEECEKCHKWKTKGKDCTHCDVKKCSCGNAITCSCSVCEIEFCDECTHECDNCGNIICENCCCGCEE